MQRWLMFCRKNFQMIVCWLEIFPKWLFFCTPIIRREMLDLPSIKSLDCFCILSNIKIILCIWEYTNRWYIFHIYYSLTFFLFSWCIQNISVYIFIIDIYFLSKYAYIHIYPSLKCNHKHVLLPVLSSIESCRLPLWVSMC